MCNVYELKNLYEFCRTLIGKFCLNKFKVSRIYGCTATSTSAISGSNIHRTGAFAKKNKINDPVSIFNNHFVAGIYILTEIDC